MVACVDAFRERNVNRIARTTGARIWVIVYARERAIGHLFFVRVAFSKHRVYFLAVCLVRRVRINLSLLLLICL